MADLYVPEIVGVLDGTLPTRQSDGSVHHGKLNRMRATIVLAAQAIADNIALGRLPAGSAFAYGLLNGDTSLATSVIAIGNSKVHAANDKYRAAAVHTATVPTLFGKPSAADDGPLAGDEIVYLTLATAALPAAGILVVDIFYSRR